jgi:hypothetical protein
MEIKSLTIRRWYVDYASLGMELIRDALRKDESVVFFYCVNFRSASIKQEVVEDSSG